MGDSSFWRQKKVFITGHTGFKGSWLTLWLASLGAQITGFSLHPPSNPHLFEAAQVSRSCESLQGDIADFPSLQQAISQCAPHIIFHLAAQPLVQHSYIEPVQTFHTNVLGTVHLLEAARCTNSVRVIINVTSDKCYKNDGLGQRRFQEDDPLGGHDPYSASKACAELVAMSYQQSFFGSQTKGEPVLANVRAGNVIGGGDWAEGRLLPDIVRAYTNGTELTIRNPHAIRPWQHVLDPLQGYIRLAEQCWDSAQYAGAWNFGPVDEATLTVKEMIQLMEMIWSEPLHRIESSHCTAYEAPILTLDSSKSVHRLGWHPKLSTKEAVEWSVKWYQQYRAGADMNVFTQQQIDAYQNR